MKDKWRPNIYRQTFDFRIKEAFETIERCKYVFQGNEHILDIGCGSGHVTNEIALHVPQGSVIGVDHSYGMIDFATNNFPSSNLRFVCQELFDTNFKDTFHLVTSFSCLHWLSDQVVVLDLVKKALKHGGQLVFSLYGKPKVMFEVADNLTDKPEWKNFFNNFEYSFYDYSEKEYADFIDKAGLEPKRIEMMLIPFIKPSAYSRLFANSWLPHILHLPREKQGSFCLQFEEEVWKRLTQLEKNGRPEMVKKLEIHAIKQ